MARHAILLEVSENSPAVRRSWKNVNPSDRSFAARFRAVASLGPASETAGAASPVVAGTRAVRALLAHMYRR